jgi:hypothetical protein
MNKNEKEIWIPSGHIPDVQRFFYAIQDRVHAGNYEAAIGYCDILIRMEKWRMYVCQLIQVRADIQKLMDEKNK